jgi:hypothetical protein
MFPAHVMPLGTEAAGKAPALLQSESGDGELGGDGWPVLAAHAPGLGGNSSSIISSINIISSCFGN